MTETKWITAEKALLDVRLSLKGTPRIGAPKCQIDALDAVTAAIEAVRHMAAQERSTLSREAALANAQGA